MRQLILSLLVIVSLFAGAMAFSQPAGAINIFQDTCKKGSTGANTDVCKQITPGVAGQNPAIKIIRIAITLISLIIGVASVIVILLSGFSLVTANGDSQAVGKARSSIIYALVGLAVAGVATAIVNLVLNKV